jgi:hypothetical protein
MTNLDVNEPNVLDREVPTSTKRMKNGLLAQILAYLAIAGTYIAAVL